jgi:aryl-alcohol dehydrogenase-like predicted oxidoreductase
MYQGDEWQKNQDFIEQLRAAAATGTDAQRWSRAGEGCTLAQLVINWTIHQPGITAALCGAKRPWQIEETAGAMGWKLSDKQRALIDAAIATRGQAAVKRAFS